MKRKNKIFASLAAILLLFESASGTVASAQTVDPQVESSNSQIANNDEKEPSTINSEKTVTSFQNLYTKYKWTAGDEISNQVTLNTPEKRIVYLQKWNGKKYVNAKEFTTDEKGGLTIVYPSSWYHQLQSKWRLVAPETADSTAATSNQITISTVRRYQIPKKYRQLHMHDLHLKGYYTSPLDKSLNYASTRNDYVEAFIKRGYEYKNVGTAWVNFTTKKPGTSVDCSGLVMQCMYATGIDPSPANPRWHATHEWGCRSFVKSPTLQTVSLKNLKRGDLIFYGRPKPSCYHIGIYLGKNKVLHSWPNAGVTVWPANFNRYYYAKRVFPDTKNVAIHEKS